MVLLNCDVTKAIIVRLKLIKITFMEMWISWKIYFYNMYIYLRLYQSKILSDIHTYYTYVSVYFFNRRIASLAHCVYNLYTKGCKSHVSHPAVSYNSEYSLNHPLEGFFLYFSISPTSFNIHKTWTDLIHLLSMNIIELIALPILIVCYLFSLMYKCYYVCSNLIFF